MKKIFAVIGVTLALSVGAAAQDAPRMEAFLGYTFARFNPTRDISSINANGGSGQFAYNFNKNFSAVIDLGAVHKSDIHGTKFDVTLANYLVGPRYGMRHGRVRPYVQALFGGVYAFTSQRISVIPVDTVFAGSTIIADPNQVVNTRLSFNRGAFGMTAGGGLDIEVNKHVSVRPVQAEYFLTRLVDPVTLDRNNQNNFRYSAGVNFTFGAR